MKTVLSLFLLCGCFLALSPLNAVDAGLHIGSVDTSTLNNLEASSRVGNHPATTTSTMDSGVEAVALLPQDSEVMIQDRLLTFFTQVQSQHQEKVYIHQNQNCYVAGDTLWFKAYLINAVSHRPDTLSNFIYVELNDPQGALMLSRKIRRDSLGFANCLPLPDSLVSGTYTLRAYTGWMLNFDPAFCFQRPVFVEASRDATLHTALSWRAEGAVVRFCDALGQPLHDVEAYYELFDRQGNRLRGATQRTSVTGALFVDLPEKSLRDGGSMCVKLDNGKASFHSKLFFTADTSDFAVQFFPEGGDFVIGKSRLVAFKGERSDGSPASVTGIVVNDRGDTLTTFRSEHDGMGSFQLCPQSGEHYYARCRHGQRERSVTLPAVLEKTCALTVRQSTGRIHYRVDGTLPAGSHLVGHLRGVCCCIVPVDSLRVSGTILTDSFAEGILHLLLVDSAGRPHSERLVFVHNLERRVSVTVIADTLQYGKRDKVCLRVAVRDPNCQPLAADLSVSVTDCHAVEGDSLADDLRTNLLLSSDLKGYIHHPGYYFLDDDPVRQHNLDLVMMTHGWRRFKTDNLFDPAPFVPRHFFEHGQYLSGRVIGITGKGAPGATVHAVAITNDHVIGASVADERGGFVMDGLDYRDTTLFMISATTQRGKPVQRIEMDSLYPRPPYVAKFPDGDRASSTQRELLAPPLQSGMPDQAEDTMKLYRLPQVEVTAENLRKPQVSAFGTLYDTTKMSAYKRLSLYNYVCSFMPEIHCEADSLYLKRMDWNADIKYAYVQLNVNGHIVDIDCLKSYQVDDVEYIYLAKDTDWRTRYARETHAGVNLPNYPYRIDIYLKPDRQTTTGNVQICKVMGYYPSVEFYQPIYDTPERKSRPLPDLRTTLYWNPYVQTDSLGNATLEFYTNDRVAADYKIMIEGITPQGDPCARTVYNH